MKPSALVLLATLLALSVSHPAMAARLAPNPEPLVAAALLDAPQLDREPAAKVLILADNGDQEDEDLKKKKKKPQLQTRYFAE